LDSPSLLNNNWEEDNGRRGSRTEKRVKWVLGTGIEKSGKRGLLGAKNLAPKIESHEKKRKGKVRPGGGREIRKAPTRVL